MKIERMFSNVEEERLYSTGNDELDELLERAFCEGYEYAQREFNSKTQKARKAVHEIIVGYGAGNNIQVPVEKMLKLNYTPAQIAEANLKSAGRKLNRTGRTLYGKGVHGSINSKEIKLNPESRAKYLKDVDEKYKQKTIDSLDRVSVKDIIKNGKENYKHK